MTNMCRDPSQVIDPGKTTLIIGRREYGRTELILSNIERLQSNNVFVVPDYYDYYKCLTKKTNIRVFNAGWNLKKDIIRDACGMLKQPTDILVIDELNFTDDPFFVLSTACRYPAWLVLEYRRKDIDPLLSLRRALYMAGQDVNIAEKFTNCNVIWVEGDGIHASKKSFHPGDQSPGTSR